MGGSANYVQVKGEIADSSDQNEIHTMPELGVDLGPGFMYSIDDALPAFDVLVVPKAGGMRPFSPVDLRVKSQSSSPEQIKTIKPTPDE